jgi:hypothetical protein
VPQKPPKKKGDKPMNLKRNIEAEAQAAASPPQARYFSKQPKGRRAKGGKGKR